ncbi:hypothetical protein GO615_27125 [Aromatoleum evansii]|nr:hypothetical protein [Aromatoleum evansii]NMG32569.1 hypothetical protein [Aromatoleum evansii]
MGSERTVVSGGVAKGASEWQMFRRITPASILTIDGVRVEYPDGFGLARPSNTTPVVVLRFEADAPTALARIHEDFRRAITGIWPGVSLPY